jgi:hypothetical protein
MLYVAAVLTFTAVDCPHMTCQQAGHAARTEDYNGQRAVLLQGPDQQYKLPVQLSSMLALASINRCILRCWQLPLLALQPAVADHVMQQRRWLQRLQFLPDVYAILCQRPALYCGRLPLDGRFRTGHGRWAPAISEYRQARARHYSFSA